MTFQNRVDPFGIVQANPARGQMMGNRGKIHDPATKTLLKRRYESSRWIICLTKFEDRKRTVMGTGYTELFFLDEVTALAAGQRPCAECRRQEFTRFCHAVSSEFGQVPKAPAMDARLHRERLGERLRMAAEACRQLPDGAMVAVDDKAFARRGGMALPWSFGGYGEPIAWSEIAAPMPVLLTPALTVSALRNGYQPVWHDSARA